MILSIIALILSIISLTISLVAWKKKNITSVNIKDIPFITIKDNVLDVNGSIRAEQGFYQE